LAAIHPQYCQEMDKSLLPGLPFCGRWAKHQKQGPPQTWQRRRPQFQNCQRPQNSSSTAGQLLADWSLISSSGASHGGVSIAALPSNQLEHAEPRSLLELSNFTPLSHARGAAPSIEPTPAVRNW